MLGDRWGVTDAEVARHYACDDLVEQPAFAAWRGVQVEAPPEDVWPWVAQVRLAPYSYDWLDNLARRSPQQLQGLPEPQVGEHFTTAATRRVGRIVSVEPGRQLTGNIAGMLMSYVLEPDGTGTRLLLKLAARRVWPFGTLLCLGDLVMARRQLLNFKRLAESAVARR